MNINSRRARGIKLNITTDIGIFNWTALGIDFKKKGIEKNVELNDYENLLRPIIGEILSIQRLDAK